MWGFLSELRVSTLPVCQLREQQLGQLATITAVSKGQLLLGIRQKVLAGEWSTGVGSGVSGDQGRWEDARHTRRTWHRSNAQSCEYCTRNIHGRYTY